VVADGFTSLITAADANISFVVKNDGVQAVLRALQLHEGMPQAPSLSHHLLARADS